MADAATLAAVVAGIQGVMIGNADVVTDERRTQVATVACEAVESYAPMAPEATKLGSRHTDGRLLARHVSEPSPALHDRPERHHVGGRA